MKMDQSRKAVLLTFSWNGEKKSVANVEYVTILSH